MKMHVGKTKSMGTLGHPKKGGVQQKEPIPVISISIYMHMATCQCSCSGNNKTASQLKSTIYFKSKQLMITNGLTMK